MRHLILAAAATLAIAASGMTAQAMPRLQAAAIDTGITQVRGGCGYYGLRGPFGGCRSYYRRPVYRPFYRPIYRVCPPGLHVNRFGRCGIF